MKKILACNGGEEAMKRLLAIGEALIDFIPSEHGKEMKAVSSFSPAVCKGFIVSS